MLPSSFTLFTPISSPPLSRPQVTLEESDQENLAELEECDESDSRADAGSSTATGTTAASGGGGPKPSGSQNQAQHGGM